MLLFRSGRSCCVGGCRKRPTPGRPHRSEHVALTRTRGNWHWLETTLEAQRQLYNAALEERIDFHRKTGKSRTYFDRCKALTACRRELPEMADCAVGIQRGTLKRLDESFKGFFNRLKKGAKAGFPKFRGRRFLDSIAIVSGVKLRDGTLHIPGFGPMTIRRKGGNPHPDGRPVSAVLKRADGKRTAVVCLAVEIEEPADNGHVLGLDRNCGQAEDARRKGARLRRLRSRPRPRRQRRPQRAAACPGAGNRPSAAKRAGCRVAWPRSRRFRATECSPDAGDPRGTRVTAN